MDSRTRCAAAIACIACLGLASPTPAAAQPLRLRVVGGLAGVSQYTRHEEPFWTREVPRLTQGRVTAEIVPFDRAGLRGQEMLRLVQVGAVPFGTALLNLAASVDPLLAAPDLAGLAPDIGSARRGVTAYRPFLEKALRERGIELLAVYAYPAQVVFCSRPFTGLADLVGRRIRTSSATQSDLVESLGAVPVQTSFADILGNMRGGSLDCAVTGTMSGNAIGLHEVTTHVHAMALNWGLSMFVAHAPTWQALPGDVRQRLQEALPRLEQAVWAEAERETAEGLACNVGLAACADGRRGRMALVPATPADETRRRTLFAATVLPRWVHRCGPACAEVWNRTLAPVVGVLAPAR